jgi:quercetin dioxygenase-like cupin family protein
METSDTGATVNSIAPGAVSRRGAIQRLGAVGAAAALFSVPLTARAQESSPTAGDAVAAIEPFPGVTAEVFGKTESARAPGQTMYAVRFTFQPGAEALPHRHPGTVLLGVVSGSLGWTLVAGTAHVVRGAASAEPEAAEDLTEVGTEIVLEVGDGIFYEDDVVHTARGAGAEPTVAQVSFLLTTGEPLLMLADDMEGMDMGTPAP